MKFSQIDLSGKVALVTGGSKGIGHAMAIGLATVGADIIIVSRNLQEGQAAAKKVEALGRKAIAISCDVTSKSAVEAMVAESVKTMGKIDILVNNAGMNIRKLVVDIEEKDFDAVINTNLKGVFLVGQSVGKQMIKQNTGGKIINVASVMAAVGVPMLNSYCASKGGIIQMTKVWALEWAEYGITVNAIGPAYIHTPMTEGWLTDPERFNFIKSMTPLQRLGTPEEVAGPVVFLSSDWSSYITGTTLYIDGGWTSR